MFSSTGYVFGDTDVVGSRFHILRARTQFRRYRGCRVPFSCFALPDSFSAVPRALGPFFMFCAHDLVFGGTEVVGSRFNVLGARSRFRRYRGRQVPFSCFACPISYLAISSASGPVFRFCAPEFIFGGTKGVPSRSHVFFSRTCFRRYRGHRVPFSCFALPDSFSAVPRASGSFFRFCARGLIFVGIEGVGSRFHLLRAVTRFRRYRECRVPFSYFALLD
jgi:hypothetical protein